MRRSKWEWVCAFGLLAGCAAAPATAEPALGIEPVASAANSPVHTAATTATPIADANRPPPTGRAEIKKYPGNYACFKITTAKGVIVVTDPFGMDEDVPADIVTVSHDHKDHNMLNRILPAVEPIRLPGEYERRGIRIIGVAGHHNKGDAGTTNVIFVFDLGGIRLAHFASQGEMPTEDMFAQIGAVDILILQMYGAESGKLSVEEATAVAWRLGARLVIPAHTDVSLNRPLARAFHTSLEQIPSGFLEVTGEVLAAAIKPQVVSLDNP